MLERSSPWLDQAPLWRLCPAVLPLCPRLHAAILQGCPHPRLIVVPTTLSPSSPSLLALALVSLFGRVSQQLSSEAAIVFKLQVFPGGGMTSVVPQLRWEKGTTTCQRLSDLRRRCSEFGKKIRNRSSASRLLDRVYLSDIHLLSARKEGDLSSGFGRREEKERMQPDS